MYKECGDTYVATCYDPFPEQDDDDFLSCGPPGWYCIEGYVRDENGHCIPREGCSKLFRYLTGMFKSVIKIISIQILLSE